MCCTLMMTFLKITASLSHRIWCCNFLAWRRVGAKLSIHGIAPTSGGPKRGIRKLLRLACNSAYIVDTFDAPYSPEDMLEVGRIRHFKNERAHRQPRTRSVEVRRKNVHMIFGKQDRKSTRLNSSH